MDDQIFNEIISIEQKIFDRNTVKDLPFSFFEYIAQIVVNPSIIDEIDIPLDAQQELLITKRELLTDYVKLTNQINFFDRSSNFINAYVQMFLFRYFIAFKQNANYVMRRIQTPLEYGILDKNKVKNVAKTLYVAFDIDKFIPKLNSGEIDINALKKKESSEHNIKSFISTIVSLPILAPYFWEVFSENTTKGFFNMFNEEDLEEIVQETCTAIINLTSKMIYTELERNIPLPEVIQNVMGQFEKSIPAGSSNYPPYLYELKKEIDLDLFRILSRADNISDSTRKTLYIELHEVTLSMLRVGMALPEYIYSMNIRNASEFDKRDYQLQTVLDLYLYGTDGNKENYVFESYGITLSEDSSSEILNSAFGNNYLYRRFIA